MVYNSKLGPHPSKLKLRYVGPYCILHDTGQGTFHLIDYYGLEIPKPVKGFCLKLYTGRIPNKQYLDPRAKIFPADMPSASVLFKDWRHNDPEVTVA